MALLQIKINPELKQDFKVICARKRKTMSQVLVKAIANFVKMVK